MTNFFDSLFSDSGIRDLASAVDKAGRRLREAFSFSRYFSDQTREVVGQAGQLAFELGKAEIDTEHLLYSLLNNKTAKNIVQQFGLKSEDLQGYLAHTYLLDGSPTRGKPTEELAFSPRLKAVLENSLNASRELGHTYIGPEHLLIALAQDEEGLAGQVLRRYGMTPQEIRQYVIQLIGRGEGASKSRTPRLDRYSRDLTALAQAGKLDPVIGRSREIETVIEILARRKKNNPILIGEPGVGKTAIVEGLAQQIISESVPDVLRNRRVVELNLNSLVSGARYRGDFEQRIKGILDEILANEDELVLFIDEVHTLVGAGSSQEGTLDAANIFKPALARGELNLIGATTLNEYQKYIEKDAALERRFQPVLIAEPTVVQTIEILRGLRDKLEAHHKVSLTDDAINAAAELAFRYITNRYLPDKAIDLVDQAAARVRIQATSRPPEILEMSARLDHIRRELEAASSRGDTARAEKLREQYKQQQTAHKKAVEHWRKQLGSAECKVLPMHVAEVVARLTGIPVAEVSEEERQKLLSMESRLGERIVGQPHAVRAVSNAIRLSRGGFSRSRRPIANFFFLGPSGVGKTELAKALAELVFGNPEAVIRLDMSEYAQQHSVARLIGAPPGYIGHDEGGQLTERIRRRPYSVLLLDEIEKAHQEAHNLLLQVMEDGRLTDSKGRAIDFSNTIVIATSNIGGSLAIAPDASSDDAEEQIMRVLRSYFSVEFLNRIDEFVLFNRLSMDDVKSIARIQLEHIAQEAKAQQITLRFEPSLLNHLAEAGYNEESGARALRRMIRTNVETKLAELMLNEQIKPGSTITVGYDNSNRSITMQTN